MRRGAPDALAALFLASGVLHFLRPHRFEPLVPEWLPARRALVLWSGAAELACAAGLLGRRRGAGEASALLLLALLPANVQYAIDQSRRPFRRGPAWAAVAWARVPLQYPLIRAALRARSGRPSTSLQP